MIGWRRDGFDHELSKADIVAMRGELTKLQAATPSMGKEAVRHRMKTVGAAIVVCLNVGVDPPDVVKTSARGWSAGSIHHPGERRWTDRPDAAAAVRAVAAQGELQGTLDPTMEDVRRLTLSMRRRARDERVLYHYNGHGVPKPTANGEIWVFNQNFTQYIPLSVYDLQWVGAPAIYVIDCSNAGQVLRAVEQAIDRDRPRQARALENFAKLHGMPEGTATLDQVQNSSAGWVAAASGTRPPRPPPRAECQGSLAPKDKRGRGARKSCCCWVRARLRSCCR